MEDKTTSDAPGAQTGHSGNWIVRSGQTCYKCGRKRTFCTRKTVSKILGKKPHLLCFHVGRNEERNKVKLNIGGTGIAFIVEFGS